MHHEDIQTPIYRDQMMQRLKQYIPGYTKDASDTFAATRDRVDAATQRAQTLAASPNTK
ncbi:MAG: hypothetical protein ACYDEV_02110 [Acidiferrobacter sp.]